MYAKAIATGYLLIGETEMDCAVVKLDDGKVERVISTRKFNDALGRAENSQQWRNQGDGVVINLPPFLASERLRPFISDELALSSSPIPYLLPGGGRGNGYRAELLLDVCHVYMQAFMARALHPKQEEIAKRASTIMFSLGKTGIVALVDEATGYQYEREPDYLRRFVNSILLETPRPWGRKLPDGTVTVMFPDALFRGFARIYGYGHVEKPRNMPMMAGLLSRFVYAVLPPDIYAALKARNPTIDKRGRRRVKQYQLLTTQAEAEYLHHRIRELLGLLDQCRDHMTPDVFKRKLFEWDRTVGYEYNTEAYHDEPDDPRQYKLFAISDEDTPDDEEVDDVSA